MMRRKNHCAIKTLSLIIMNDDIASVQINKKKNHNQKREREGEEGSTKNIKNFTREKIKDKFLARMCAITFQKLFALNYSRKMSRKKRKMDCAKVSV